MLAAPRTPKQYLPFPGGHFGESHDETAWRIVGKERIGATSTGAIVAHSLRLSPNVQTRPERNVSKPATAGGGQSICRFSVSFKSV
jgi:hypothetical protein